MTKAGPSAKNQFRVRGNDSYFLTENDMHQYRGLQTLHNVDTLSKVAGVSVQLIAADDVFLPIRGLQANRESKWHHFE